MSAVGPGIAEALIATAIGLGAAIPAAIFYNYFGHVINEIGARMDDFSLEFLNLAERNFGEQLMAISLNGGNGNGRGFGPRRYTGSGSLSEINVTPFVDVVLVLLVIFMLTAHVMEFGLEVDVPEDPRGERYRTGTSRCIHSEDRRHLSEW